MNTVAFDPSAFTAPAGLDLRTVSGSHPEKAVKVGIRPLPGKDRCEYVFQPSDDISAVSLVTEPVIGPGVLCYLTVRRGFRKGGKVGVEQIDKEFLLNRSGSGTIELFQKELVLDLVIFQFQTPTLEVELLKIILGIFFIKNVGCQVFGSAIP